MYFDSVIAVLA